MKFSFFLVVRLAEFRLPRSAKADFVDLETSRYFADTRDDTSSEILGSFWGLKIERSILQGVFTNLTIIVRQENWKQWNALPSLFIYIRQFSNGNETV